MESIVCQTYRELEILLIDDQSPDRCPEMCDRWAERDSRIRVIHKLNEGVGKARNTGLDAVCGDYFVFADPDDYLPLGAIKVLLDRVISDQSDMAVGKIQKVFEDGHTEGQYWDFLSDQCLRGEEFLRGMNGWEQSLVSACAKLYSRAALEGIYFPPMTCGEDMWVFPLIALQCKTVSTVDYVVYCYFQRTSSTVHTITDAKNLETIHSSLHMARIYLERGYLDCASRWFGIAVQYVQELKGRQAGIELMEALFQEWEIRRMLRNGNRASRAKWFLLCHPRLYDGVFGVKRAVTALLKR